MSYNILSGGFRSYDSKAEKPERFEQLVTAVKSIKADFVGLIDTYRWNNIFSKEDLKNTFGFKNVECIDIEDETIGMPVGITVMTNCDVKSMATVRLYNRNAIKTTTDEMDIYTIYLDHAKEETRLKQVRSLLENVNQSKPTIVVGDFNAIDREELETTETIINRLIIKSPMVHKLKNEIEEMEKGEVTKLIKENGFKDADPKGQNTAPTKIIPISIPPIIRIDYAFYNKYLKINRFDVLYGKMFEKLSDHYPIVAEVECI